jgi:hypothetical protein
MNSAQDLRGSQTYPGLTKIQQRLAGPLSFAIGTRLRLRLWSLEVDLMDSFEKRQSVSLNSVAVVSSELVSANLDGEVVILGFKSGSYYGLDRVGVFVWDLLQQPRQVSDLRDAIFEQYDVDLAQCERDLLALLVDLADRQLIEINNEPAN